MMRNIYLVDDDDAVRASLHSLLSLQSDLAVRSFRSGDGFLEDARALDSGVLLLDKITLAADPADTGTGERLSGTVTATLTRAIDDDPVGTLQAFFDFTPPRRPLTDFK